MFGQICFLPLFTTIVSVSSVIVSVSCYAEFLKTDEVQQDIAQNQNNNFDENRTSILSEMEFPSAQTPRFVVEDYSATPVLPYTPIIKHVQPLETQADNSTRKWRKNRGERVTTKYRQFRKGPISRRGKISHQTSYQLMAPFLHKQGASSFIVSRNMPKASKKKWLQQFLKQFGEDKAGDVTELQHTSRQKRLREIASLFLQFHPNASEKALEAHSASDNRNIKTNEDLKQEDLDDIGDNIFEAVSSESSSDEDDDSKSNSDDTDDKFENNSDEIDDKFENYYSQEGENNDRVDDSDSNRKHNKSSSAVEVSNSLSVTDRLKQIQNASFSVSKQRGRNALQESKLQNQARLPKTSKLQNQARHPRTSRHYHAHYQRRLERKERKSTGLQKRKNSKRHQRKFNMNIRRSVLAQFSKSKTRQGVVTNLQTVSPLNKQDDTDKETDSNSEDDSDEEKDSSSEEDTDEEKDSSSEEDGSLNKKNDKSYDSSMNTTADAVEGVLSRPEAKTTDEQPNSLSKSSWEKITSMEATAEAKQDTKRIKNNVFQTNYSIDKSDSSQQGKSVALDKTVIMDSSQSSSPVLTSVHGVYVKTVLTNDSQIHGFGFVTLDAKSKSPSSLPTSLRIQHKKVNASGTSSIPARESILKRRKRGSDLEHQVNNEEKYVRLDSPQNQQPKPRVNLKRNWIHSAGTLNNPLDETGIERGTDVSLLQPDNVKENVKVRMKENVKEQANAENGHIENGDNKDINNTITSARRFTHTVTYPSRKNKMNSKRNVFLDKHSENEVRSNQEKNGKMTPGQQEQTFISISNPSVSGRNNTDREIHAVSKHNNTNRETHTISGRNNTNRETHTISGHNNTDQGIQHANLRQRKESKQGQLEQLSGQDRKERKGKGQNQRRNSRRGSLYGHMSDRENSHHKKNKKKNGNKPGLQNTKPLPKLPTVHRVSSVGQTVATVYRGSNSSKGDEITEGVISRAGLDGYGWEYKFKQPSTSRISVTVHSNRSVVPSQTETNNRFEDIGGSIAGSVDGDSGKVLDKRPAAEVSHNTEFIAHDNKITHHDKSNVTVAVRSPFIHHRTAYDFLSSRTRSRSSQNMDNEMQRERVQFGHTISEGLCEIFNKHFVPTSIGGLCE